MSVNFDAIVMDKNTRHPKNFTKHCTAPRKAHGKIQHISIRMTCCNELRTG